MIVLNGWMPIMAGAFSSFADRILADLLCSYTYGNPGGWRPGHAARLLAYCGLGRVTRPRLQPLQVCDSATAQGTEGRGILQSSIKQG